VLHVEHALFCAAQSATYRTIIDDVIANIRQDFDDVGIEREVLEELQRVSGAGRRWTSDLSA
jgi:hypothetical protein